MIVFLCSSIARGTQTEAVLGYQWSVEGRRAVLLPEGKWASFGVMCVCVSLASTFLNILRAIQKFAIDTFV